jgi:N-acetylmuramoyl-L-alanine amidase
VFKFAGFIVCGALILLAGCATQSGNDESLPAVWVLTNAVPAQAAIRPVPAPVPPGPPPATPQAAIHPTWTSLDHWAAGQKLTGPKRVGELPVASYSVKSSNGTLDLAIGSREVTWKGMEVLLGFPPELIDGQVFVHALDLEKNLEPLLLGQPLRFGSNRVVVIDPGHGGSNTGTHNLADGRFEKEFTLDWAMRLRPLLESNGWTVFLTRTNDTDVSLADRVAFASRHHADLFISLHFNSAAPNTSQNGLETYCLTPTGMPSTLKRGYSDLWTDHYPNNNYDVGNLELALRLQSSLLRATGEEDRGIRRARFMSVLQGQQCPAVLIEGGFLSNPAEAKKIENPAFRQKLAEGVAEALR